MTLGPLEINFQKTSGHCFALKMKFTFQDMNVGQKVKEFEIQHSLGPISLVMT
jgi:hypothetical protein